MGTTWICTGPTAESSDGLHSWIAGKENSRLIQPLTWKAETFRRPGTYLETLHSIQVSQCGLHITYAKRTLKGGLRVLLEWGFNRISSLLFAFKDYQKSMKVFFAIDILKYFIRVSTLLREGMQPARELKFVCHISKSTCTDQVNSSLYSYTIIPKSPSFPSKTLLCSQNTSSS